MHEELKKEGQQAINYIKYLGEMKKVNVESALFEGHVADELIRYAEEEQMDIITGTLGINELDRLILGRAAENLVRHSKVPVMVVSESGSPEIKEKCKSRD
jgi:nucleotide-binding universal stress UspA family protein